MSQVAKKMAELGLVLPAAPAAVGAYVPALRTGSLVMTSGQLNLVAGKLSAVGKVGSDLNVEQGGEAATVGSLDRVQRVLRLEGFVQSAPGFHDQPAVLNPASNLLQSIFGEAGRHVRIAIGAAELPLNAPVQLALWCEVE
jgi:enamine deaminase RidA (YjgF/YER057c/UK114 family)